MIDTREDNRWTVYIHIVPKALSGYDYDKYYVGITSKSIDTRWKSGLGYKTQLFGKAINKYGWKNIEHYIIAENLTKDESCDLEIKLIKELSCNIYKDKYGYNETDGGEGSVGYKASDNTKKLISKNHVDVSWGNNSQAKIVYQFDSNKNFIAKYTSYSEAEFRNNICPRSISQATLNRVKAGNYYWCSEDDIIINNGNYYLPADWNTKIQKRWKKVYGFNQYTNEHIYTFDNAGLASKATNISYANISGCALNKFKYSKISDYIWRYEEDIGFTENGEPYFIA